MNPYLDDTGLIRLRGRIGALEGVDEFTKRPILLPRGHHVTNLLVLFHHYKLHHQYDETVVNELRQRYHISKLRVVVKMAVKRCQWCKVWKAKPNPPMMAELPSARLKPHQRPFSFIGIDFFGPMYVKDGRRQMKRWGMLVTCLTIRAVHIEIVHSMSTESCILALRNFMSIRGTPIEIFSDCGTNFIGANRELMDANEVMDSQKLMAEFSSPNTKWTFNPPASPHFGGSWERLVQSVKKVLTAINVTRTPSDELLTSMLKEVANIINARPLTYVPLESEHDFALTPNHFLLGTSSGLKPLSDYRGEKTLRSDWVTSQQYLNKFWERWIAEFAPIITRRSKWVKPAKPIEVGDIVLIVDDQGPRNCWPKGKVIATKVAKDGQVRRVTVQTTRGVYERPSVKIAVLDIQPDDGKPSIPDVIPGGSVSNAAC